jgi:hypothetical protein
MPMRTGRDCGKCQWRSPNRILAMLDLSLRRSQIGGDGGGGNRRTGAAHPGQSPFGAATHLL